MLAICFARICLQVTNCKHRLPCTVRRHTKPDCSACGPEGGAFLCAKAWQRGILQAYSPAVVTSSKHVWDVCCRFRTSRQCLVTSAYEGEAEVFEKHRHFRC